MLFEPRETKTHLAQYPHINIGTTPRNQVRSIGITSVLFTTTATNNSSPALRRSWPSKHAALLIPIAEHNSLGGLVIQIESMRRWPMRVSMNQQLHAVFAHR